MCSGFHSSTRSLSHPASAIGCHIASEIFVSHGIIFFFAVLRPEYFRARFFVFKPVFSPISPAYDRSTRITLSPRRKSLLMKRSRLMGLPFLPSAFLGTSLHISLTFSRTMLQWRSKALTRASSLRLLRVEMRTWVWLRTAVWRSERGPEVNSWVSRRESSYSL